MRLTQAAVPRSKQPRCPAPDAAATVSEAFALVADELRDVEACFRAHLASPLAIIQEIGDFVADGEGKRVRPALHLLCARMCSYSGPHHVLLATVLEFIHSATLIHDDIIDDATTRRGRPSVNREWGNSVTVLFGDYMYAKAMQIALQAGSLEVMDTLAEATLKMSEGEMLQTRYVGRSDLTVPEHLDLVERKTAVLFAACCELAGILAGTPPAGRKALRGYGLALGLAFQLVDDLLDFTGDAATLGKPAASDLREGKVTLAVIDLLATGSARAQDLVQTIMTSGRPDTPEIAELTDLLHRTGAFDRTQRRARQYAEEAVTHIRHFPPSSARQVLEALADLLVFRDR